MPRRIVGTCCCAPVCDPVSFAFVELSIAYRYEQRGATKLTYCALISAMIDVTHRDGRVERIDGVAAGPGVFSCITEYDSNLWHVDNQGFVFLCGRTAQWRAVFDGAGGTDFTGDLNSATTSTYGFN